MEQGNWWFYIKCTESDRAYTDNVPLPGIQSVGEHRKEKLVESKAGG